MSRDEQVTEVSFAGEGVTPRLAVVQAVAESEGVDPVALPPLHELVPPLVLDGLFEGGNLIEVEFTYNGYEITILRDERVIARKRD